MHRRQSLKSPKALTRPGLPEAGGKAACLDTPSPINAPWIKVVKSYLGLYALGFGAANSERFGFSHQIGQRFRGHLLHDVPAMDLHGDLGKSEFACYLFVQQTR